MRRIARDFFAEPLDLHRQYAAGSEAPDEGLVDRVSRSAQRVELQAQRLPCDLTLATCGVHRLLLVELSSCRPTVALLPDRLIFPAGRTVSIRERRPELWSGVHGKMNYSTSWPGAFSHAFRRQDCRPSVLRMAARPRYLASRSQCLRSPRSALLASTPALPGLTPEKAA